MQNESIFNDTGKDLFREGESVFINKAYEAPDNYVHTHDFIEIAYVASGSGLHIIDDMSYEVTKGDLFVINYDVAHAFRSYPDAKDNQLMVLNCIFKPEYIDSSLLGSKDFSDITYHFMFKSLFPTESGRADFKLIGKETDAMEALYEKMYREYTLMEEGYQELIRAYIIELLVLTFRLYRKKESANNHADSSKKLVINKVLDYVRSHYQEDIKLDDLSSMTFLSRSYLSKVFKDHTGMTITEYGQKIRIEEACRLLKDTDKKILEVCHDVGYSDVKFFNKVFKRVMGKTPSTYRKAH